MCGITGIINWGDSDLLARMTDLQAHRGPDDRGTWHQEVDGVGFVGLGSRRLAILDLSPAGHMPWRSEDGAHTLVFNGEIYNFRELKSELEAAGFRFRSTGDTEVVLKAYQHWGPDCVKRLNGMFALALWDQPKRRLFMARDHFGIKPLYYICKDGRLVLASELKSLHVLPGVSRAVDPHALHQYLSFLWVPEPRTIFQDVLKLPVAHYAIFEQGRLKLTRYWNLQYPPADHRFVASEEELAREIRNRFTEVVRRQMLSDVPVGAFLSAGMDSSSIVACMAKVSDRPVHTYTIAFPEEHRRGAAVDDTEVAERTAAHFGCVHQSIVVQPKTAEILPRLVWHMDEPVADPAIITAYLVNREARKDVTVLLSGIGGDEVFGGYRKYQAHYLAQNYQRLPRWMRSGVIEPIGRAFPPLAESSLGGYVRFAKKMLRSGSLPPQERFIMDSVYMDEAQKRRLYTAALRNETVGYDPRHRHLDCFSSVAEADFLNQMLYLDCQMFLPSLNLNYNDKMSMAASAEVRVPFLDVEFVEWVAATVAPSQKMRGGVGKYILRKAMAPVLPAEVLRQGKAGFGAPVGHWLRHDLREMVGDLLSPEAIRRRGYFEPAEVERLCARHYDGSEDNAFPVWQLLTFELWCKAYVD
jgi:asparagine synthase (glutamine-hydrolysing)